MVTEPRAAKVHLTQPVEKKQSGLNHRIPEFPSDEFEGRHSADFQQQPALPAFLEQRPPPGRFERRRLGFRNENPFDDGQERVAPPPQRRRVRCC